MAHGHNGGRRAKFCGGFQNHVQERNLRGRAFTGIAFGAQVTGLQDLLKEVSLKQAFGQPAAVHLLRSRDFPCGSGSTRGDRAAADA